MKHTLLVVDDEGTHLQTILKYLEESGQDFIILIAPNGKIACHLASEKQPDIILMDWNMPVMSGIEAVDKLKSDPSTKDIPILMVTSRTSPEDLQIAIEKGAMDYIQKPINKVELLTRVNIVLQLSDSLKKIKELKEKIEEIKS